jgi:hypothetical protein
MNALCRDAAGHIAFLFPIDPCFHRKPQRLRGSRMPKLAKIMVDVASLVFGLVLLTGFIYLILD